MTFILVLFLLVAYLWHAESKHRCELSGLGARYMLEGLASAPWNSAFLAQVVIYIHSALGLPWGAPTSR